MAPHLNHKNRYKNIVQPGCVLLAGGLYLGMTGTPGVNSTLVSGVESMPVLRSNQGQPDSESWYRRQPLWNLPAEPGWTLPERMNPQKMPTVQISSCSFIEDVATNPLAGVMVEAQSAPAFVDIDNDSDMDVFVGVGGFLGTYDGTVAFFENTGDAMNPAFIQRTGTDNPLDAIVLPGNPAKASIAFVDLDHDLDFDAFLGNEDGLVRLARNDGDKFVPSFVVVPSGQNPLSAVDVGAESMPSFVDVDADGDVDAFVGIGDNFYGSSGTVEFWKNSDFEDDGILNSPSFSHVTGSANPLEAVLVDRRAAPAFIDCGLNGISDAVVGEFFDFGLNTAKLNFFENTGSASSPDFILRTGTNDPFDGKFTLIETDRTPAIVDIDGDGDLDVFAGQGDGSVRFFRNSDIVLPVELSKFEALTDGRSVILNWQTASEQDNAGFEIEHRSTDDVWRTESFVPGHGSSNKVQAYTYRIDEVSPGDHHFRLKQLGLNGSTHYSAEVSVNVILQESYILSPAFPNPFNPEARFSLLAEQTQYVRVAVYDALGRQVRLLHDGEMIGGQEYRFTIDGNGLSSGVYLYEIVGENFRETQTVMLVK